MVCIVSGKYKSVLFQLRRLGVEIIEVPICHDLQEPVSQHADMVCYKAQDRLFLYNYNEEFTDKIKEYIKVETPKIKLSARYPYDVAFNAAAVGDYVICNKKYVLPQIARSYDKIINVPQGYTKCSTLILSDKAIITTDKIIASESKKHGIESLYIEQKDIILEGYDYGFIGGCGFMLNETTLFLTGKNLCADAKDFLKKLNINTVCCNNEKLIDIGSIIKIL